MRRADGRAAVVQKAVVVGIIASFTGMLVVAGLDHRFGWSTVPTALSVFGDVMVAVGLGTAMLVVFQNRCAAANIVVEEGTAACHHRALWRCAPSDVLCRRGDDGRNPATWLHWALLVTAAALVLLVIRTPRRGEDAARRVGRLPRLHAAGALPVLGLVARLV